MANVSNIAALYTFVLPIALQEHLQIGHDLHPSTRSSGLLASPFKQEGRLRCPHYCFEGEKTKQNMKIVLLWRNMLI